MHRLALNDYTFHDGLSIPAGTDIAFTNELISKDPGIRGPDATKFDAHRFLHIREGGDPTRAQMTSVTNDMLPWGSGPHACPGRFLAADGIKMMVMNLVYRYEFKYPKGITCRPENDRGHLTMGPCSTMSLYFKEKKAYGF
jgi:cytochrome P450